VNSPRANIVGTGLIGGSVGMALRLAGWHVSGVDLDDARAARALEVGALDVIGLDENADVTVVATPVGSVAAVAVDVLGRVTGAVTDVGSVKAPVVGAVDDPRFVGGHPMAGSEQDGIEGARPEMFDGAVWVLTPTDVTDDASYTTVRAMVSSLGAEVIDLEPASHDAIVADVSHVPHLTAAVLMAMAADRSVEHRALLRLAAGGFRDMTRIAASPPDIWPDICAENRSAITASLDRLIDSLGQVRSLVANADRAGMVSLLDAARQARVNLPTGIPADVALSEIRVPIFDRPGELARITTLATEVGVNIFDVAISHSGEGAAGVLAMIVETDLAERLVGALMASSYRPTTRDIVT
jgi:prephenate dehydrogenase